eukprot:PRCOL_00001228-RA
MAVAGAPGGADLPPQQGGGGALGGVAASHVLQTAWALAVGGAAGAVAKTVVAPLERVRLLMQTSLASGEAPVAAFAAVVREEGVTGLWRGNGLNVSRAIIAKGTLFATQDALSKATGSDMLAGGLAGLAAGGLTYPIDLMRTRHAGGIHSGGRGTAAELWHAAFMEATKGHHGLRALYAGGSATLGGAVAVEGIRFGVFGALRRDKPLGDAVWAPAVYGWAAGTFAGLLIYPNDTIRRRLQYKSAPLADGSAPAKESYLQAGRRLVADGGVRRLYRGAGVYLVKIGPSNAIQFAVFSWLKGQLERAEES